MRGICTASDGLRQMLRLGIGFLFAVGLLFSAGVGQAYSADDSSRGPLEESQVQTLRATFGLSLSQAEANLGLQEKGTRIDIVGQMRDELGKSFAGVWFDNEAGEFVVPIAAADLSVATAKRASSGVSEEFAAAALGADSYRTEVVESSTMALEAAQRELDEVLEARGQVYQTALDPSKNSVVVRVPTSIGKGDLAFVQAAARSAGVAAEVIQLPEEHFTKVRPMGCDQVERFCDRPIRGGQYIYGNFTGPDGKPWVERCSVGFRANGNNGKKYILTAGHCVKEFNKAAGPTIWNWSVPDSGNYWFPLGTTDQWHYDGKDWAKIDATGYWPDVAPWPTILAFWDGPQKYGVNLEYPVVGEATSYKGQTLCHVGARTGSSCGVVEYVNSTIDYGGGEKVNSMFEVYGPHPMLLLDNGDSGGSVVASNIALGLVSGGYESISGVWMYFSDIVAANAELNTNLVGQGAPEGITGAPTSVGPYSATVTGQVNPHGLATSFSYEYGQGNYGKSSFSYSAGSGQGFVSNSTVLPFLEPNADYQYRIKATNALNSGWGEKGELKTPPVPPIIATKPAADITGTSATFNATVDPEGAETTYYIEWGKSTAYGSKSEEVSAGAGRDPVNISIPISGLEFGANYHYRVVASSIGGTSQGADVSFTPGWWQRNVPIPAGGKPTTTLTDVDCTSVAFCTAVGYGIGTVEGKETARGVLSSWVGGDWTSSFVPVPSGKTWTQLQAIDCVSASDCWAVGGTGTGATWQDPRNPLVSHWDGSSWQSTSLPSPAGTYHALLSGVSCASATSCIATGLVQTVKEGLPSELAMRWNGSEWSLTTNPPGALPFATSEAPECVSATLCYAPGAMSNPPSAPESIPFVNRWNGSTWTRESLGGGSLSWFKAIDCVGSSCVAAGVGDVASQPTPFVGELAAGTWKSSALPQLLNPGDKSAYAHDLSCNALANCQMVGRATLASGGSEQPPLAARIVAGTWERQTLPSLPTAAFLSAVSCPSATFCAVVGKKGWSGSEEPISAIYTKYQQAVAATKAATGAIGSNATLNGTVDPKGSETTYYFEYGPTTAYGTKTSSKVLSGSSPVTDVSAAISGLTPGQQVHFRVVTSNAGGTVASPDAVFVADGYRIARLEAMKVTEPFDGTVGGPVSAWSTDWVKLPWLTNQGVNNPSGPGWTPPAYSNIGGAAYQRTVSEVSAGLAAQVTMSVDPGGKDRWFALWSDVPLTASSRAGYQLKVTKASGTFETKYNLVLFKWVAGASTELAAKANVDLLKGDTLALADEGGNVSAWVKSSSGYAELLSAADSTFADGRAGIEGSGNNTRLRNFKVGALLDPAPNMTGAIAGLPVRDSLGTPQDPLSGGGAWAASAWITSGVGRPTGIVFADGWGPADAHPTANGAYWTKASFADTGSGNGVAVTVGQRPVNTNRYLSFWLNVPTPTAGAKTGYEVRFTEKEPWSGELKLTRWQLGVSATLGSVSSKQLTANTRLAITRKGNSITVWWNESAVITVTDSTLTGGFAMIEGTGIATRLKSFQAGQLQPF